MGTRESAASSAPDCAGRNGAHTPWKTKSDPFHYDSKTDVVDARGDLVACMCGTDVFAMEANARLIAAAPELATSASAAERKLVELRALLADNGISCPCTDEIVQLQDALIKAGV